MRRWPYFLLIALIGLSLSCKKTGVGEDEPDVTGPGSNYAMKEVEIKVPSGSSFKAAGSKVFSFGTEYTADGSGKAKVAFENGSSTLAYVFNADKKLVLAGFITDSTNVISPATTAKVLLYFGYNIPLQSDTLSTYFLNNINKLSGYQEWEKEFETLFLSNALILSDKSFVAPLKARMAKMIDQTPVVDIRGKAADIYVDAADIKSGIQVSDDGLSKFKITNNYRRRAHAFLYKMSYKDMNNISHPVKTEISKFTKADKDMIIDPVSAVSGFMGELGKTIEGKGEESFSVTSGPFPLELGDNESEAFYRLRIVGPGATEVFGLTDEEQKRLTRLEIETFLLDFVVPTINLVASVPEKPTGAWPEEETNTKVDKLLTLLGSMPDVSDEIKKGNYKEALKKFLEAIYGDITGKAMDNLLGLALDAELAGNASSHFNKNVGKALYILEMVDAALGASDLVRIASNIYASKKLEYWEIKARAGQVRLLPDNSVVVPFQQQKLTAEIKNNTQTAYYEWSTTGKYGKLTDTKGHKDLASFSSSDKVVTYESKVNNASLSVGDNIDYIYVTAYAGGVKVGVDTAIINVKKEKYEMRPTDITLSGRESGVSKEVRLYLEKSDGTNSIAPNANTDYKVIWSTAGKYGKLNGVGVTAVRTLTVYDDNSAWYECYDKDTKEAVETVTARVYSKPKGAPDSEYKIFDEVKGTIKINNDPKKKIIHIPTSLLHADRQVSGGYNCWQGTVAYVPEEPDAVSYSLRFYGQKRPTIGANTSDTWTPTNHNFSGPPEWVKAKYVGKTFTVVYSYGAAAGPVPGHVNGSGNPGMAEVIITLK